MCISLFARRKKPANIHFATWLKTPQLILVKIVKLNYAVRVKPLRDYPFKAGKSTGITAFLAVYACIFTYYKIVKKL